MSHNFEKVFILFKKKCEPVPLEVFKNNSYKTLVSTILSSRTKDEVTYEASRNLFKNASNIYKLDQLGQLEIRNLIYPVGFYKTKAKHLKQLAKLIIADYGGTVPDTRDELSKLPGVGRKKAKLVLNR